LKNKGDEMAATECKMEIIEKPDFSMWWQCSNCGHIAKDTKKFMKLKACPSCGSEIVKWDEDYEDFE
jgi:rRNA maturation endonuclease Nob1